MLVRDGEVPSQSTWSTMDPVLAPMGVVTIALPIQQTVCAVKQKSIEVFLQRHLQPLTGIVLLFSRDVAASSVA